MDAGPQIACVVFAAGLLASVLVVAIRSRCRRASDEALFGRRGRRAQLRAPLASTDAASCVTPVADVAPVLAPVPSPVVDPSRPTFLIDPEEYRQRSSAACDLDTTARIA